MASLTDIGHTPKGAPWLCWAAAWPPRFSAPSNPPAPPPKPPRHRAYGTDGVATPCGRRGPGGTVWNSGGSCRTATPWPLLRTVPGRQSTRGGPTPSPAGRFSQSVWGLLVPRGDEHERCCPWPSSRGGDNRTCLALPKAGHGAFAHQSIKIESSKNRGIDVVTTCNDQMPSTNAF